MSAHTTHTPRKRFGQNFLINPQVISDILDSAVIVAEDHWVEIGPGLGALTEPLLANAVDLDVIELDRNLIGNLQQRFAHHVKLSIHHADALSFDFAALVQQRKKLRLIGNLPYNISTPLLFHLLSFADSIQDMLFMLQKEVVQRICAPPGNKSYGRLSVMLQYYCAADCLFTVPPESFDPPPKVDSAIVRLVPHRQPPVKVDDIAALSAVVTQAFSQRRKTLRNSLAGMVDQQQLAALAVDPQLRAEALSLEQFASIANLVSATSSGATPR